MERNVKCLLLKVNVVLITEIVELGSQLGEPDCKLINPHQIDKEGNLTPWPDVSEQNEMLIHSDSILTIVNPKKEIIEKYLEIVS